MGNFCKPKLKIKTDNLENINAYIRFVNEDCIKKNDLMQSKEIGKLPKKQFFKTTGIYQAINNKWYCNSKKLTEPGIYGNIKFISQNEVYKRNTSNQWIRYI